MYIQSIKIENWWILEESFLKICELFINEKSNEVKMI